MRKVYHMPWFHIFKLKHFCWETWWSCNSSWSLESLRFPAPTQAYYPHHEGNKYPGSISSGGIVSCVMEFLYISFHPYIIEKSHQFLRFPKELQHLPNIRSSRGQRSLSPVSPISRWQKWYTIWCKKLWPTSASHKPSGWPRQGVKWHHLAHPFGAALAVELPGLQAPVFYFLVEWSEWSITANYMNLYRPAKQPTQQTKRPTATGVIKVYGFDVFWEV